MAASGVLAAAKLIVGTVAGSTAVVADGFESVADVVASGVVLLGLSVAVRPADWNHPYGHGRFETLTGLGVGAALAVAGAGICYTSLQRVSDPHPPPEAFAVAPLVASIVIKAFLWVLKLRIGRRTGSSSLIADAYNDGVDILSGTVALTAVALTLADPRRFLAADHYGGAAVGLIVIFLGLSVVRETSLLLMDTMPDAQRLEEIRRVASEVDGARAIEKCFARKTGLQYHVDLHLTVDPDLTVRASHEIASRVRAHLRNRLDWVADVLVHVEPDEPPSAS